VLEHGIRNEALELGLEAETVFYNDLPPALIEHGVQNGEGQLAPGGAFLALTGQHTGRSPKDKFTVRDASTEDTVDWVNNADMSAEHFDALHADMIAHAKGMKLYVQDLSCGADPSSSRRTLRDMAVGPRR